MEIAVNLSLATGHTKRFEFIGMEPELALVEDPGLKEFLRHSSLSGDVTEEEVAFLKALRFTGKRPTALYYYRELQSHRDPPHFRAP